MGKGNRVRIERADKRKAKKEAAVKAAKKAQLTHNLTLAVMVILVVAIIASVAIASIVPTVNKNNAIKALHNDISVTSASDSLNNAEMTYLLNYGYLSYMNQYGSYASYFYDTSKSMKDQKYTLDENEDMTWYDYFLDQAKQTAEQLLVLNEEAKARGITLTDEEKAEIDESLETLSDTAKKEKMSVDEYIESNYGVGINVEDLRHIVTLQSLASKVYTELYDEPEYTGDEIEKYCQDNLSSFYKCDYKSYAFKAEYDDDADDATKETAQNKALESANALAEVADTEAFDAIVKADLKTQFTVIPDKEDSEDSEDEDKDDGTITESELQEKIDATASSTAYSDSTDLGKWAFEKSGDEYVRKVGDKTVITSDDKNTYTVYYLTKTIYRDTTLTKNVRHILISLDTSDADHGLPDEEAKAKADELLKTFNDGDKTEDSFAKLAKENSTDHGSAENGGLYENVKSGDMVDEFNDWIYDTDRKAGDTGIVKSSYGYHVMYFVGDGVETWAANAEDGQRSKDYEAKYDELKKQYEVKYDDELLKKVEPVA